jgi:hypothetical protein
MSDYYMSDADVNDMHPRQAEILIKVPAQDRRAVLNSAHLMMNCTGGTLSGCLWSSEQEYRRLGADELAKRDRLTNARLMGWRVDENGHRL